MQYNNLNHLWWDTLKTIMTQGDELDSRAGKTKEILGFQAILTNPLNNILLGFPERKFSLSYASAELLWYLSGTNKIEMISAYAPSYKNYAENGMAFGAYGYRWKNNPGFVEENKVFFHPNGDSQLAAIIYLLKEKPETRQAIITCWNSGDLIHAILGDKKDLPCTLALNFFVRKNKLYLITTMRSNDCWLGLPYDIFTFTSLQRIIAAECKLGLGIYIHQAGSEHIYEKNYEKINKILEKYYGEEDFSDRKHFKTADHWLADSHKHSLQDNINTALNVEQEIRNTNGDIKEILSMNTEYYMDNLFQDLIAGCGTKWLDVHPSHFYNPLFQEWQKQNLEGK